MMMPSRSGMRTASRARTRSSIAACTSSRVAPDVAPAWRRADSTSGVEREDRRVGRRDLVDQRALRGVAFAAEDLAHDELALLFAMAAAPNEIGERLIA